MKINTEIIKSLKPCDDRFNNYLQQYSDFNGDIKDFILLEYITYDDKIWVITKLFNKKQNVKFAIMCASSVLSIFESKYPDDNRPRKALEAAENWLLNPTEENKYAVYNTVGAAADAANAADAAAYAADTATYAADTATYAAANAAYYAANAATNAATYAATNAATYAATNAATYAATCTFSTNAATTAAASAAYYAAAYSASAAYYAADSFQNQKDANLLFAVEIAEEGV